MASINTTLCIYRLGIGELQVEPLNPLISEKIALNSDVDTSLYARTSAFVSYTNTIRTYNLTFTFASNHEAQEIIENPLKFNIINGRSGGVLEFMRTFQSLLYANYDNKLDTATNPQLYARTIKSPPMFKIRFSNYIRGNDDNDTTPLIAKRSGLLGSITNVNIDPFYAVGYVPFSPNQARNLSEAPPSAAMYSQCKFSFDFIPLYDQPLGWSSNEEGQLKFSNNKQFGSYGIKFMLGD